MQWGEAYRLARVLVIDPSSQLCAAVRGWTHPLSREDMILRDTFDLQHSAKVKKRPKPYPRPWDVKPTRIGGASLTIEEFRAAVDSVSGN